MDRADNVITLGKNVDSCAFTAWFGRESLAEGLSVHEGLPYRGAGWAARWNGPKTT